MGVLDGFGAYQFAMVSEWMIHGNIMEYIKKNATNRLELVCIVGFQIRGSPLIPPEHQLHGAAQGLKYLHDANITHGDLKGVRDSTPSNVFAIVSYSAVGKHSHDKSHAPSGVPCGFWVHDNGA